MAGRAERRPRWSLGLGGVDRRRRRDPGAGQFAAEDPRNSSICLVVWKEKKNKKIGVCDHGVVAKRAKDGFLQCSQ